MANFTITAANSLTTGTTLNDQFTVNTSLGVNVEAGAGDDQIFALGTNFTNAQLFGGQGNDSIYLSAAGAKTLNGSFIAAGAGNDLIVVDTGVGTNASIVGGGGNDIIQFSGGLLTGGQINGNQGNDLITASGSRFVSALIGAGGGVDTIRFDAVSGVGSTINGGGGNDLLAFSGVTFKSGTRLEGDTLGDSQFFGNDTINLGVDSTIGSASTINGGQGNDVISLDGGDISTGLTVEGNQGEDSIFLSGTVDSGATFLGGGQGQDTITVSAALAIDFGTIQGGGGVDVINVSGDAGSAGFIFGGAGADAINLGTITGGGDLTTLASGVNVAYSAFSESNFAAFDTISAGAAAAATGAFMINQSVVNFAAVASGINGAGSTEFTTNTGAVVDETSFTATRTTLTARAEALDANLTQGQAVVFDVAGQNYLFVQGGAAVSGLANDMLVELDGMAFGLGVAAAVSGGLAVVNNSALKVVFE